LAAAFSWSTDLAASLSFSLIILVKLGNFDVTVNIRARPS
jgi:hypothetical protein